VEDLTAQIATKDAEIFKLKNSLGDLSKEVGTKTAGIESKCICIKSNKLITPRVRRRLFRCAAHVLLLEWDFRCDALPRQMRVHAR
jgi:hypothetical protein